MTTTKKIKPNSHKNKILKGKTRQIFNVKKITKKKQTNYGKPTKYIIQVIKLR